MVKESQRNLTTFVSLRGRYRRIPFGLMNAPSQFQQVIDTVLDGCKEFSGCYIDDVLVYSESWELHLEALRYVLRCLMEVGFTVKMKKCCFGKNRLQYLSHWIGCGELRVLRDR